MPSFVHTLLVQNMKCKILAKIPKYHLEYIRKNALNVNAECKEYHTKQTQPDNNTYFLWLSDKMTPFLAILVSKGLSQETDRLKEVGSVLCMVGKV